ncbi:Hsp20/alpha crystallin family protein [Neobacillus piezotolerans]|uniref:Hsp20/alpha crystallin family protein n=1 Tax=Neobacillus piezotolerans TaxID=2259171 RepID=A0A3D8GPN9_9BACI|nr:Hsp20/alpha crystallin family protein [Neobacillus piezotolerans]RDU36388.1 Hsp20/alpha crystallin family protein [Neobacillus piezotolerans]
MPDEGLNKKNDQRKAPAKPPSEPLDTVIRTFNDFFHYPPVKGFLQSIDDFFQMPFSAVPFHVDVQETTDEYILTAELPGVGREQIQIGIFRDRVVIAVENREELSESDETEGSFRRRVTKKLDSRSISFPKAVNEQKAKATYRNGLLTIRLPIDKGKQLRIEG